jgi:hypothetical protein
VDGHAPFGWLLVTLGLALAGVGLGWLLAPSVPRRGRSPGGVGLEWETFRLSFPLVTCLFLGVLWDLVRWLLRPFGSAGGRRASR